MTDPWFFGYGSLVNVATHDHRPARPARLHGWRREWRHTELRPVAFLTAVPDPGISIHGVIAPVPGADWQALDLREAAYERVTAEALDHDLPHAAEISVYTIPEGRHGRPTERFPVLLSYIDVVVEGYLRLFGEDGVADFFRTTAGWEAPIADDRHAPRYARAQTLSDEVRDLVDTGLAQVGARKIASP